MGFVDGEGAHADALGELQESRHEQTLRRNEEQPVAARGKLFFGFLDRVRRHAAVKRCRRIAALAQAVDLVFHQRDQRRDDDVRSLGQFSGNLVAERFAAAGGHDHERVAVL